ncbi:MULTISPECIES: hypothetical protein [unclassified Streptomyces]|uniref:hypothetical protein n=1 Tax=unclassified Streptomyces TaxID=2593676 RepID=UPI0034124235
MSAVGITRDVAVRSAAEALLSAIAERATRTPREAAEAAYYPGHPLGSVDAIEAEIAARREREAGEQPLVALRAA